MEPKEQGNKNKNKNKKCDGTEIHVRQSKRSFSVMCDLYDVRPQVRRADSRPVGWLGGLVEQPPPRLTRLDGMDITALQAQKPRSWLVSWKPNGMRPVFSSGTSCSASTVPVICEAAETAAAPLFTRMPHCAVQIWLAQTGNTNLEQSILQTSYPLCPAIYTRRTFGRSEKQPPGREIDRRSPSSIISGGRRQTCAYAGIRLPLPHCAASPERTAGSDNLDG